MTVHELNQLYYLNREIDSLQSRIAKLKSYAENPKPVIDGLPKGQNCRKNEMKEELIDLIDLLALKQKQCIVEHNRLERYINSIDDSMIRLIFAYRFVNGLSWRQISFRVGGGNTADSVRMMCNRFLKKNAG